MIDSIEYKLHPEAFKLMKQALASVKENNERASKPYLLTDMIFVSLFLYARRVGSDKEHIEFLSEVTTLDTLSLTDLLGAIDKYQKELGL